MKYLTIALSIILTAALFITGCSDSSTYSDDESKLMAEASITLNNSGASAYIALSVTGEGAAVSINTDNPEITLTTGGRYTFINKAGVSSHPLDFRNDEGVKLFGQSRNDGSFDGNPDVNVIEDENSITFTLTDELAERLSEYICSFHPGMNGSLNVIDAN